MIDGGVPFKERIQKKGPSRADTLPGCIVREMCITSEELLDHAVKGINLYRTRKALFRVLFESIFRTMCTIRMRMNISNLLPFL